MPRRRRQRRTPSRTPHIETLYVPTLYIRFITFSIYQPIPIEHPALPLVDCSVLRAPPSRLCGRFTGLDPEIQKVFFSSEPGSEADSENMAMFKGVCKFLDTRICGWRFAVEGHFLVVPIACTAGIHRSVSMAEKLARDVSYWEFENVRLSIKVEHTKLWRSVRSVANTPRARNEYTARARYEDLRFQNHMARMRFEDLSRQVTPGGDDIIRRRYIQGRVRNIVSEEIYLVRRAT